MMLLACAAVRQLVLAPAPFCMGEAERVSWAAAISLLSAHGLEAESRRMAAQERLQLLGLLEGAVRAMIRLPDDSAQQACGAKGLPYRLLMQTVSTACAVLTSGLEQSKVAEAEPPSAEPPAPEAARQDLRSLVEAGLRLVRLGAEVLLRVMDSDARAADLAAACARGSDGSLRGSEDALLVEALLRWSQATTAMARAADLDNVEAGLYAAAVLQAAETVVRLCHRIPSPLALASGMGWPCTDWTLFRPEDQAETIDELSMALMCLGCVANRCQASWFCDGAPEAQAGHLLPALLRLSTSVCKLVHAASARRSALQPLALLRAMLCMGAVASIAALWQAAVELLPADDIRLPLSCVVWECCAAVRRLMSAGCPDAGGSPDSVGACEATAVAMVALLSHVHATDTPLFHAVGGSPLLDRLFAWLPHNGFVDDTRYRWVPVDWTMTLRNLGLTYVQAPQLGRSLVRVGGAARLVILADALLEAGASDADEVADWIAHVLRAATWASGMPRRLRVASMEATRPFCHEVAGARGEKPGAAEWRERVCRGIVPQLEAALAAPAAGEEPASVEDERAAAVRRARALACRASCANLGCTRLAGITEEGLRGMRCSGCNVLRFCCAECSAAEWKAGHRRACRLLAAEQRG